MSSAEKSVALGSLDAVKQPTEARPLKVQRAADRDYNRITLRMRAQGDGGVGLTGLKAELPKAVRGSAQRSARVGPGKQRVHWRVSKRGWGVSGGKPGSFEPVKMAASGEVGL